MGNFTDSRNGRLLRQQALPPSAIKNEFGQYFTPPDIARFMVSLAQSDVQGAVLEPCAGEGVFLKALKQSGRTNITAIELDPELAALNEGVITQDFMTMSTDRTFDLIIGNPPYIRWRNIPENLQQTLLADPLWKKYCNKLTDYSFAFIIKAVSLLAPGGELIFICSDYWLSNTNAAGLRRYLLDNGSITDIYSFREIPVFAGVSSSLIVFRYVRNNHDALEEEACLADEIVSSGKTSETAKIAPKGENSSLNLNKVFLHRHPYRWKKLPLGLSVADFTTEEILPFKGDEVWRLLTKEAQESLNELVRACRDEHGLPVMTGDVLDIASGMVSGLDEAFNITGLKLNEAEAASSILVVKSKDLVRYGFSQKSTYFFYRGNSISREDFISQYPNVATRLLNYEERLNRRYNYGRDIPFWEFVFPRSEKLFRTPRPRIIVPCKERITSRHYIRFALCSSEVMPLQDITALLLSESCKESPWYVLAWLSSARVFEWLVGAGIVKGGVVEFAEKPLSTIPYRRIKHDLPIERAIHDQIVALTQEASKVDTEAERNSCHERIEALFTRLL